ncbi:MAG: hypothetical protein ABI220_05215 [Candidatus Saccharimonadales bacterium]
MNVYNISLYGLRLLDVTIFIPYALIWLAGFYGFARLKSYSSIIKRSNDGKQINRLANGVLLLALWLPVSSIVNNLFIFFSNSHPSMVPVGVIVSNYLNLALPLAGFILIGLGVRGLNGLTKLRPSFWVINGLVLSLILLSSGYGYLLSTVSDLGGVYHLHGSLVLTTLAVPYVFMWCVGVMATYGLYLYQKNVVGIVYRRSWRLLFLGVAATIILQVVLQYFSAFAVHLHDLSVEVVFIIAYLLLVLLSVGYILIARGAKTLQKIEEV